MKLYHGTSAANLASIQKHGLRPRGRAHGNWSQYPSRPDCVYLTTAYAPYFAMSALSGRQRKILIVEVDSDLLDESLFMPDEDFISQAIAANEGRDLAEVHDEVVASLGDYRHHWRDSVAGLGNASYECVVPPEAITRRCVVDLGVRRDLSFVCDPCVSLLNYKFCGERYRSITAWLFGDRPDFLLGIADNESQFAVYEKLQPGYKALAESVFANKEGICVTA